jgi:gamma-glutamylcyclotransferase (GGCT)/AIG2-like uncharacterized protein YtfP
MFENSNLRPFRAQILAADGVKALETSQLEPTNSKLDAFFVYGTLQPGEPLYSTISRFVKAIIVDAFLPKYSIYGSGYPFAVADPLSEGIWGTILYVEYPKVATIIMDEIELCAGYERVKREVKTPYGTCEVWLYEWPDRPPNIIKKIESGDWMEVSYATR